MSTMGIKRVADGAASASGDAARRRRGGAAPGAATVHQPGQPPRRDPPHCQRDPGRPDCLAMGERHLVRVGLRQHTVASRARGHFVSATAASAAEANNCRRASSAVIHPRCSHSRPASESPAITTSPNGMER